MGNIITLALHILRTFLSYYTTDLRKEKKRKKKNNLFSIAFSDIYKRIRTCSYFAMTSRDISTNTREPRKKRVVDIDGN